MRASGLFIVVALFFLPACRQPVDNIRPESGKNLVGLAGTVQLEPDTSILLTRDYFLYPHLIDSVSLAGCRVKLTAGKDSIILTGQPALPLGALQIFSGDTVFSLPVRRSDKQPVLFSLPDPQHRYRQVAIAGDLNQWNPRLGRMVYKNGAWQKLFRLPPGPYQYKLVIDGRWQLDPANPDSATNNIGGYNSLRVVPGPAGNKPFAYATGFQGRQLHFVARHTSGVLALWQNQQLDSSLIQLAGNKLTITLPAAAGSQPRSHLRIYTFNENMAGNDLLVPLHNDRPVRHPDELNRTDWQANILYFMMVDRFFNGDTTNDRPLNSPEVHPRADFHGGDISGITQKLQEGYFDSLHINAIWLSPIGRNPEGAWGQYPDPPTGFSAYHGYWPTAWTQVDPRFGSSESLKELVQTAHRHNMNVLLDFVANHVHQSHPIYRQHPEWATELYLPDGSLNTERWDEYRLTTWFDVFLPTLDLTNPELADMLTDSIVFWLKAYDLDGFRHDATKHVPASFWRQLTRKIKKVVVVPNDKKVFQIGETYGSHELIASYVSSGLLDAQFDFAVYDNALACFARPGTPFQRLRTTLEQSFKYYGHHHKMGNITGNQDKPRFMAYAGGDLRFEEDSKLAGWTRNITVTDPRGYERLKMFIAFNMTIPGIPVIYYGDEIGMTGANDPDNRRDMRFDNLSPDEEEVKATTARLAALRQQRLELSYGEFHWLLTEENVLAYARTYFDRISIILFNKDRQSRKIMLKLPAGYENTPLQDLTRTTIQNRQGKVVLDIQPESFMIIQNPNP